ncbi:MAG: AAA family ATPase [Thermoleophilaceae bacterium]
MTALQAARADRHRARANRPRGSAREAEIAALSTRQPKLEFDLSEQRSEWRAIAQEHCFGPDELAETLGRASFRELDREEIADTVERLLAEQGITGERSAFARRDLVEAIAAGHTRGGSVQRIEALADRLIESDHIVALEGGEAGASIRTAGGGRIRSGEPLLTTVDMLDLEARMLDGAAARVGEGAAVVDAVRLQEGFERRPGGLVLSDEQQAMVRRLVTSGDGVEVVRAKAGTGKTTALDAARELWESDGRRVVGTALAGRAADELRSRAGIESYTIHGLLQDLDRGGDYGFSRGAVLVVDEAGMVGTRKCDRLLAHAAAADAKVVLVGDERQLAAIEAGGALAALADRLGASELCEVHRQAHVWDREALDQLRHGDISRWVEAYRDHGRLVAFNDADDQLRALVEDWYVAAHSDGMDETLMLAVRRHEVEALNQLARGVRVAAAELDDTAALAVGESLFAIDDRVLATRNTHVERADGGGRIPVRNGNAGSVTRVDHIAGELGVRLDSGVEVTLPSAYLDEGHLMHGYARTIHKSQGSTAKRTFVLGSPDLARELGYVAASRHTDQTRFYLNVGDDHDLDQPPAPGAEDNPLYEELERTLGRERAKALAFDQTEVDADLGTLQTTELLEITDRGHQALRTVPGQARRAKDVALLERAAAAVEANERRLETAREALAGAGRRERRQLEQRVWGLEDSVERGRGEVTERTDQAAGENIERWLEQHEMQLVEAAAAGRELAERRADAHWRARRTAELDADPALEALLGDRPEAPQAKERWERAAAAHEAYRLQYGDLPAGHDPDILSGRQVADWDHARELAEHLHDPGGPHQAGRLLHALDFDDLGPDLGP